MQALDGGMSNVRLTTLRTVIPINSPLPADPNRELVQTRNNANDDVISARYNPNTLQIWLSPYLIKRQYLASQRVPDLKTSVKPIIYPSIDLTPGIDLR